VTSSFKSDELQVRLVRSAADRHRSRGDEIPCYFAGTGNFILFFGALSSQFSKNIIFYNGLLSFLIPPLGPEQVEWALRVGQVNRY